MLKLIIYIIPLHFQKELHDYYMGASDIFEKPEPTI